MLGGTVGSIAHRLMPGYTATAGAYDLVGMGTVFAGIVRAPMTSVMMIFETTHDYAVIVPLMISNMVSFFISTRLQKQPIYDALAIQDGLHLPSAESRHKHVQLQVGAAMRDATDVLPPQMTIREAFERSRSSEFRAWPITDSRGVVGVITAARLERELAEGAATTTLGTLVDTRVFPHVHPDQSLDLALERMGAAQLEALPVVSRTDVHKLEGIITLREVLDSYGVHFPGPT
jgi:CIC family chloride channel protein